VLPGLELQIKLTPDNLPERKRWPTYAAGGATGLGVLALATGGFLGGLSQLQPAGNTRAEAQQDERQKRDFARAANISFGTGALLGIVATYFFIRYSDDIFGRTERYEEAP